MNYPALYAPEYVYMQDMSEQQKMVFLTQYSGARKDTTIAVLLALFLGGFGAHRFYLGNTGLGILYILFFWTLIPSFIALIECLLMSERVRRYNAQQAAMLAAHVKMAFPNAAAPFHAQPAPIPPPALSSTR